MDSLARGYSGVTGVLIMRIGATINIGVLVVIRLSMVRVIVKLCRLMELRLLVVVVIAHSINKSNIYQN